MLAQMLHDLPLTFIPLFVAIDIFAVLPIFLGMTVDFPPARRPVVIRESVLTALIVGLGFIALGKWLFSVLGITGNDFKIAGGIVLLVFAVLDLVRQGKYTTAKCNQKKWSSGKETRKRLNNELVIAEGALPALRLLVPIHFLTADRASLFL